MALTERSLFLYGLEVTTSNNAIDFKGASDGPELQAVLNNGPYSLTLLTAEVKRALEEADPDHTYNVTADRSYSSNTQNRITIATYDSFLSLLFGTGSRLLTSASELLGFNPSDYTGSTSYTGATTTGTSFIPTLTGYNYLGPDFMQKKDGALSIAASGFKEAIIFSTNKFIQVEFKYNPQADVIVDWMPFFDWSTEQKPYDFTPEYTSPSSVYSVTLESTSADSKGMAFTMKEQLPSFPFLYETGMIKMRLTPSGN